MLSLTWPKLLRSASAQPFQQDFIGPQYGRRTYLMNRLWVAMGDVSDAGDLITAATSGVHDLADLATSALSSGGPAGAALTPVVNALRDVWEGYFGVPIPPGTTNWNAYTHQQLYDMLWDKADVGDVSSVAADWGKHGDELADNATALTGQRTALASNWSGAAAEPATAQLGGLANRTSAIANRAHTVQQAAQNASDALAIARNTMPPPPGDPIGFALTSAVAGAGAGAAIGGVIGAGAGGVGAVPGALIGAAIGAVAAGGASLFLASVAEAEAKARAVRVMQRYEASLLDGSQRLPAAGPSNPITFDGADATMSTAGYLGPIADGEFGVGAPWARLTSGIGANFSGARSGAGLFDTGGVLVDELGPDGLAGNGMWPGKAGLRRQADDEDIEHHNKLPIVDQKLFTDDWRAATPVIGLNVEGAHR